MNHIVFFGYYKSFSYFRLGGLESFYRRLSDGFSECGFKVTFVFYGDKDIISTVKISENITVKNFKDYKSSMEFIIANANIVYLNYILKKHRAQYTFHRTSYKKQIAFGEIHSGLQSSSLLRLVTIIKHKLFPVRGICLSLTKDIFEQLKGMSIPTLYIPPPIPQKYFNTKPVMQCSKLNISYIGRLDENKGILDVLRLAKKLAQFNITIEVNGYFAHGKVDHQYIIESFSKLKNINLKIVKWEHWSEKCDDSIIATLQKTDILVLPYVSLEGTMDPPLLVLEGMASNCAILSKDVGGVLEAYGESEFIIKGENFTKDAMNIIEKCINENGYLYTERTRANKKIRSMNLSSTTVAKTIIEKYISLGVIHEKN